MEEKRRNKVADTVCYFMQQANDAPAGSMVSETALHVQEVGAALAVLNELGISTTFSVCQRSGAAVYNSFTIDGHTYEV